MKSSRRDFIRQVSLFGSGLAVPAISLPPDQQQEDISQQLEAFTDVIHGIIWARPWTPFVMIDDESQLILSLWLFDPPDYQKLADHPVFESLANSECDPTCVGDKTYFPCGIDSYGLAFWYLRMLDQKRPFKDLGYSLDICFNEGDQVRSCDPHGYFWVEAKKKCLDSLRRVLLRLKTGLCVFAYDVDDPPFYGCMASKNLVHSIRVS